MTTATTHSRHRLSRPSRDTDSREPLGRSAAATAGALWVPFGAFQLLTPLGQHTRYDVERDFDVVIDSALFALYSSPGAAALIASAIALLLLSGRRTRSRRSSVARAVLRSVIALGVVGLIGIAARVVPAFMVSNVVGTTLLGFAAMILALDASGHVRLHLGGLAAASFALLSVWPLVWALGAISPTTGAFLIGVYGLGWSAVAWPGWEIREEPDPASAAQRTQHPRTRTREAATSGSGLRHRGQARRAG